MLKSLMLSFLFFITSCGGGGGGSSTTEKSHIGAWSVCLGNSSASTKTLALITDKGFTSIEIGYSAANCADGNEEYKETLAYNYVKSGNNYSYYVTSNVMTSLSSDDVDWNNDNSWCGASDWTINVPKNILGVSCNGVITEYGDDFNATIKRTGNSINFKRDEVDVDFSLLSDLTITDQGQNLANGNYIFSNGEIGYYLRIQDGAYLGVLYQNSSKRLMIEAGNYVDSSNNSSVFSIINILPDGCIDEDEGTSSTYEFNDVDEVLLLKGNSWSNIMVLEKTDMTIDQFSDEFLGGGYSQGCITI